MHPMPLPYPFHHCRITPAHNMEQVGKYKIVGDVYEIQEDGTLVHVPTQKVLSRMSYTHEQYLIVDKKPGKVQTVTANTLYALMGLGLIAVTVWAAVVAHMTGRFL